MKQHRIPITAPFPERFTVEIKNELLGLQMKVLVVSHLQTFYGIDPICPHANGPLQHGEIIDIEDSSPSIICPYHHYEFNLSTGGSNESVNADTWNVELKDDSLFITLEDGYSCTDIVSVVGPVCEIPDLASELESLVISDPTTLIEYAVKILNTVDPCDKVAISLEASDLFLNHDLPISNDNGDPRPPHAPPRDEANTVHYSRAGKLKKGGSGMFLNCFDGQ
jgi:nitrite reductase/ring-hydroxylating ferredoxin subunit